MSIILNTLLAPLIGPMKGLLWVAEQIKDQADAEIYDDSKILVELSELELRLDLGQIELEDFEAQEDVLLQRLQKVREAKKNDNV
ncbi:gas vesicle protein GvpG [Paracoccaceae bacterium Fryx2]|nr:gas vesicle protein GvpG [Paracoccaceae bacterium Fryx2]